VRPRRFLLGRTCRVGLVCKEVTCVGEVSVKSSRSGRGMYVLWWQDDTDDVRDMRRGLRLTCGRVGEEPFRKQRQRLGGDYECFAGSVRVRARVWPSG